MAIEAVFGALVMIFVVYDTPHFGDFVKILVTIEYRSVSFF